MSYYDDHEEEIWCDMEILDDCERMDFYLSDKFKEVFGDENEERESVFTESDEDRKHELNHTTEKSVILFGHPR